MKNFRIIDLHCDTIVECVTNGADFVHGDGHISLDKLDAGGSLAQCFAIWIPTGKSKINHGLENVGYYEYFHMGRDFFKKAMEENKDRIRQARTVADIERNKNDGILSAILTIEDSIFVEGKPERITEARDIGVRMMGLIWNNENCMAYPNRRNPQEHMLGLKDFGKESVKMLNEYGMIIDVSHLNEGGFWDVIDISEKPIAASHSCARALCDHPRNLTDEQLKAIGQNGGIVGINFYDAFLNEEKNDYTSIADIVRHAEYIADKAGIEAVGFGSDFDGIDSKLEFKDFTGFPLIVNALEGVFSETEIDKICYENFLRVMKDNE